MISNAARQDLSLLQSESKIAASLIAASSDLTLVIGADDIITDLTHSLGALPTPHIQSWRGRPVEDVVHSNSKSVLRKMLRSARNGSPLERFDISHPIPGRQDLPIQYSALQVGGESQIVLLGRDMSLVTDLQSRLLSNRQSLEQNTQRQKQIEAHYRLLFETTSDALIIVDAESGRIREANPRVSRIFGASSSEMSGKKLVSLFAKPEQGEIQTLLARVHAMGAPETLVVRRTDDKEDIVLGAELFRAGDLKLVMIKVTSRRNGDDTAVLPDANLASLVRNAAEAVVLTDVSGLVLWTNEAFLALAQIPVAARAHGKSLDDFFQWSGLTLDMLLANVERHGRVQSFGGTVRGAVGQTTDVELSAISMPDGSPPGFGFVMRSVGAQDKRQGRGNSDLSRTAESLIEMIGRVPMKDLVRDTTDVIERMCIEAALKLTDNNRASAAKVLGLSRQALYLKMNRFGIAGND